MFCSRTKIFRKFMSKDKIFYPIGQKFSENFYRRTIFQSDKNSCDMTQLSRRQLAIYICLKWFAVIANFDQVRAPDQMQSTDLVGESSSCCLATGLAVTPIDSYMGLLTILMSDHRQYTYIIYGLTAILRSIKRARLIVILRAKYRLGSQIITDHAYCLGKFIFCYRILVIRSIRVFDVNCRLSQCPYQNR